MPLPATTVTDAYDGEGNRVAQKVTSGGGSTTTTTDYVGGGAEEVISVNGGSPTLTSYYSSTGLPTTVNVGGTLSTLGSDGIGSTSAALAANGTPSAQQLYLPYGGVRYSSGVMPTARGFTGQYGDAATGLDYYDARYYDPLAGQVVSADSVLPGDGMRAVRDGEDTDYIAAPPESGSRRVVSVAGEPPRMRRPRRGVARR
ncbi:MAG TPA: RHS repeat-associated core domain-containing protein [Ktedonobacterales bacterium]|nr:RHS repeat-associated core domain-containing protein [Ktedonobacterales bacterium]